MVEKKERAQAKVSKKTQNQVLLQLQSSRVLPQDKKEEIFCRETFGSRYALQVLEFERECNKRCTDEEEDASESDYSEWDTIEQEDTMEELNGEWAPTEEC